jgi:hypothetical protein
MFIIIWQYKRVGEQGKKGNLFEVKFFWGEKKKSFHKIWGVGVGHKTSSSNHGLQLILVRTKWVCLNRYKLDVEWTATQFCAAKPAYVSQAPIILSGTRLPTYFDRKIGVLASHGWMDGWMNHIMDGSFTQFLRFSSNFNSLSWFQV